MILELCSQPWGWTVGLTCFVFKGVATCVFTYISSIIISNQFHLWKMLSFNVYFRSIFDSRCLLCSEVLFGADYLLQFYISRNKLDFLFSLMAFVDVVTLFPILVFKLVCLGIRSSSHTRTSRDVRWFLGEFFSGFEEFLRCLDFLGGMKRAEEPMERC